MRNGTALIAFGLAGFLAFATLHDLGWVVAHALSPWFAWMFP